MCCHAHHLTKVWLYCKSRSNRVSCFLHSLHSFLRECPSSSQLPFLLPFHVHANPFVYSLFQGYRAFHFLPLIPDNQPASSGTMWMRVHSFVPMIPSPRYRGYAAWYKLKERGREGGEFAHPVILCLSSALSLVHYPFPWVNRVLPSQAVSRDALLVICVLCTTRYV